MTARVLVCFVFFSSFSFCCHRARTAAPLCGLLILLRCHIDFLPPFFSSSSFLLYCTSSVPGCCGGFVTLYQRRRSDWLSRQRELNVSGGFSFFFFLFFFSPPDEEINVDLKPSGIHRDSQSVVIWKRPYFARDTDCLLHNVCCSYVNQWSRCREASSRLTRSAHIQTSCLPGPTSARPASDQFVSLTSKEGAIGFQLVGPAK